MKTASNPSPKQQFDLTTPAGQNSARGFVAGAGALILLGGIGIWLYKHLKISGEPNEKITDIIAAGKNHDVAEIEVTTENVAGIHCDIPGECIDGVNIKTTIGSDNKVTLHIKYK